MTEINVAVIGCGAVTQLGHLPAAGRVEDVRVTLLVDKNRSHAEALAHQYNVLHVAEDYTQLWDNADAAIVALPHYLHAPVSIDLLSRGIHVLVEKPMALTVKECDRMIEAAQQSGAVLAVGLVRRFCAASQFVKQLLKEGGLGQIRSFDVREGDVYAWPVASDFFFRKEAAGGGVLIDTGAHVLDMLLWWLGDYEDVEYYDDAMGGVEADCELHLTLQSGAEGAVELSRTRQLRNSMILHGDRGSIEVGVEFDPAIRLQFGDDTLYLNLAGKVLSQPQGGETFVNLMQRQLLDFIQAIQRGCQPFVPGQEARRSVALFEECYRARQPLAQPWVQTRSTPMSTGVA